MVLMLELVGIGVFGACLSALLCMIADCTEVPKVISFKQGLLKPEIIRPVNWPQWKSGVNFKDKAKRQMCQQKLNEPFKPSPQKLRSKIPQTYRHLGTSACNLKYYSPTMCTKAVDTIAKYWKEDCECCGNIEKSKQTRSMDSKDNKMRLMMKSSVSRIKAALVTNKNDKFNRTASNGSYKSNETTVRIKKRRFKLPKNLIVAQKPNNLDVEEAANIERVESFVARMMSTHGEYCYLEALRIKNNKADINV